MIFNRRLLALIKKELKRNLSIVTLFECPTVTLLAAKLSAASEPDERASTSDAALRGRRRRNVIRRKAS